MFPFAVKYPGMRAKELVRGAGEEVTVQRLHIDEAMRSVLDGIDKHFCAGIVCQLDQFCYVRNCANRIGGMGNGNQFRGLRKRGFE